MIIGRFLSFLLFACFAGLSASSVYAASSCVPGVPCLTYTVGNDENLSKAQDPASTEPSACDGDFMNQIYARAYLGAQREVMSAQLQIRKADSVLEYSCFDKLASKASADAGALFSGTTAYSSMSVPLNISYSGGGNSSSVTLAVSMGAGHMQGNMSNVVLSGLGSYISSNFGHSFLGGALGSDYAASTSSTYTCEYMNLVYGAGSSPSVEEDSARCLAFSTTSGSPPPALASDPFYTFTEIAASDIRVFPSGGCTTDINTGTETYTLADMLEISKNPVTGDPANPFKYASFDPMRSYHERVGAFNLPASPSSADWCPNAPLPTGLTAIYYEVGPNTTVTTANPSGLEIITTPVPEMICSNPGCYYDKDASPPACVRY